MTSKDLLPIFQTLAPELFERYQWSDIWERPLENGAAYEWTVIASLIHTARENGYEITLPFDEYVDLGMLYPFRNEIPFQHAAQAGHSLDTVDAPLVNKFLSALIPKVTFNKDGKAYSIFTEGFPYHKLMSSKSYTERPDIVIAEGRVTKGYPELVSEGTRVNFAYTQGESEISGQLRIIKNSVLPLTKREPAAGCEPNVTCIIETTVNKTYVRAMAQLNRYSEIFSNESVNPKLFLVSANNISGPDLNSYFTDLSSENIISSLNEASLDIFSKCGLA